LLDQRVQAAGGVFALEADAVVFFGQFFQMLVDGGLGAGVAQGMADRINRGIATFSQQLVAGFPDLRLG
jgi:hypothetical protein